MQRFSHGNISATILRFQYFLPLAIFFHEITISIGRFLHNSHSALKAHNNASQSAKHISREMLPRHHEFFKYGFLHSINQHFFFASQFVRQCITHLSIARTCRLIIQQIHMVASSTCYHNSVHCMMPMVNTLFIEAFCLVRWHSWHHFPLLV